MASASSANGHAPDLEQRRRRGLDRPPEGKAGKGAFGFNAATEEYEDLVKAGVIDPTKVVRAALQNAASVASLMLSTCESRNGSSESWR